jgi:hypothetical protein
VAARIAQTNQHALSLLESEFAKRAEAGEIAIQTALAGPTGAFEARRRRRGAAVPLFEVCRAPPVGHQSK